MVEIEVDGRGLCSLGRCPGGCILCTLPWPHSIAFLPVQRHLLLGDKFVQ